MRGDDDFIYVCCIAFLTLPTVALRRTMHAICFSHTCNSPVPFDFNGLNSVIPSFTKLKWNWPQNASTVARFEANLAENETSNSTTKVYGTRVNFSQFWQLTTDSGSFITHLKPSWALKFRSCHSREVENSLQGSSLKFEVLFSVGVTSQMW